MRMLTLEEHKKASAFLKERCLTLWDVENNCNGIPRNMAQTGFPITLTCVQKISNDDSIIIFENLSFARHIDEYQCAFQKDKSVFRKGNALGVLRLMYDFSIEKTANCPFDQFIQNVCTESCSYIIHIKGDVYNNKVLRIDTFRKIDENKEDKTKTDFSGGLFHALNHFTLTKTDKTHRNYMFDIRHLRYLSAYAFYLGNEIHTESPNTIIKTIINPLCCKLIKFVFYSETNSNVHFIKTIIPK